MSVRRCQQEVDSAEFNEWMAYSKIERFGAAMDDLRLGGIAAAIYNNVRDSKAHPEPFDAADVFPWMASPTEKPANEPILLDDPVAQSNLLRSMMAGKSRNGKKRV